MSVTADSAQQQRKRALDQLKFRRTKANPDSQSSPSTSNTLSTQSLSTPQTSPSVSTQSSWTTPPIQSRDGSAIQSRYFSPTQPTGTVLVPNSSPLRSSSPTRLSPSTVVYAREIPGLAAAQTSPHGGARFATDLLSSSSDFIFNSNTAARPVTGKSYASENVEKPRFNLGLTSPIATSVPLAESPDSPAILRPGQRRKIVNADAPSRLKNFSTSSDDSLPQPPNPESSRLVHGARPPAKSAPPSAEDEPRFVTFRLSNIQVETAKARAAWVQSGCDEKKAEQLLRNPNWVWKTNATSPQTTPRSVSGRVKEADEEAKARRLAGKERARKSAIYANRVQLETSKSPARESTTPPPGGVKRVASPESPEVQLRRPKRARKLVESDDDVDEAHDAEVGSSRSTPATTHDESDVEIVDAPTVTRSGPKSDSQRVLEYFNDRSVDELRELTGCSAVQADKIAELRPFKSVADLKDRLGQGKKKAGPEKISPRLFEDCVEIFEGYSAVDSVLEQCEDIGTGLQARIARWQGTNTHVSPKKTARNSSTSLNDDIWEDGALSIRSISGNNAKDFLTKQPRTITEGVQLKEYQLLGVNWLRLMHDQGHSAILADEMGLGKTIQVIGLFAHLHDTGNMGPHLVVVPSSTLENWVREFSKFAPGIKVQTYYGPKDERSELRQQLLDTRASEHKNGWEVLITTYNLASGDDRDRRFMRKMQWDSCVFDEGHMLKNYESQKYKSLIRFGSKWKLLLTGTPLQNNLQELVSLMNFILPDILGPEMDALRAVFKTKGDSRVSLLAKTRVTRAKRMMTPFVLRRRKDQVLKDLPKKVERIEWCDMTPLQRRLYDEALQRSRKTIMDVEPSTSGDSTPVPVPKKVKTSLRPKDKKYLENSANVLMDLRKASSHPMLFRTRFTDKVLNNLVRSLARESEWKDLARHEIKEELEIMSDMDLQRLCYTYLSTQQFAQDPQCLYEAGKVDVLLRLLDEYFKEGRKVLLFSQFVQNLDILIALLQHKNIKHLVLTGQTPVDQRQALVDEFTEDETIPLFLLSTKAGGMGINLIAASVVILFDQDFNPHNDRQAQDRAYRIGQKRDVDVIKLITRGSIEEDMLRLGQTKLALDQAVAGDSEVEANVEQQFKMSLMGMLRKQVGESNPIDARDS